MTKSDRLEIAEILLSDVSQKVKIDRICEFIHTRDASGTSVEKVGTRLAAARVRVLEVAILKRTADLNDASDEAFDRLAKEEEMAVDALINLEGAEVRKS